ncbi:MULTISPECIES: DUF6427 family protein [Flavobacterium]|jgi:hypothetical protein|uniref:DUF6427 family protein n=1 Tax=Flavobacterium TaxID=237 RepID=UPI000C18311B|nr:MULTISPECIES: DUF6427 family protein [Flavobacterium]MDI5887079.1 DUF6427 family protein [Flavobacterium yafengii]PIF61332.1 hypothetical protein CLV00_0898 [Flavobacterium sp. 11]RKS15742.1 hypothetical protein C8C87_3104 [Flavobacterium sp. 120]WKL42463.1 DUF6427 family protein [Flavobacterium sp. ZE23DGlu08]
MITSVFRKSTPLNFSLVVILMLVFFSIYQFQDLSWMNSFVLISKKGMLFCVLLASVFITNFVVKKNGLSKDSSYTVFFYFLFLLFFPSVLDNLNLILSNFFILLALRRLISLQSLKASKEKIFDASLWVFLAALFHFWSIIFIVLVFISIIFHVSRDYRNWILPFIAFFIVGILFMIYATVFDLDVLEYIIKSVQINFEIDYFTNNYQNGALSIYATVALFFLVSMFATLSNRPQLLHTSFKKIIASFFIGVVIFLISANKSNDLLLFTFAPLAMMATSHIEIPQEKLNQELVMYVLTACSFFAFFSQL